MLLRVPYPPSTGTPPDAPPGNLVVTADGGYSRMRLTWDDDSSNETGFEIERSPDGSTDWTLIDTVPAGQTWFVDIGLTRGDTYYYRVRAVNADGESAYSSIDSDTVFDVTDFSYRARWNADPANNFTDLSGTTPVSSDGDLVRRTNDLSGNNRHLDVASDSNRPAYKVNIVNGKPVLRFTSDDYLQDFADTASTWKFLHDGSGHSVIFVWRTSGSNPNDILVLMDTAGGSSAVAGLSMYFDDRTSASRFDTIEALISKGTSGTPHAIALTHQEGVRAGAWHVTALRFDGAILDVDNDGQWGGNKSVAKTGTASSSDPAGFLRIGAFIDGTKFLQGDIAEIAITTTALSDADYRILQEYYAETYDVAELHWFGSETLVTHDASGVDANEFPGMCVCPNGDLLIGYSKQTSHAVYGGTGAALVTRRSTDRGDTWGSEVVVYDNNASSTAWMTPTFNVLADDRIFMTVGKRVSNAVVVDGIGYFVSDDNGLTWDGPIEGLGAPYSASASEGGGITVLDNGDWLMPFYGQNSGDTVNQWSCGFLRSSDEGDNWSFDATVAPGVTDNKVYGEMGFVETDGGDLLAMIREEGAIATRYRRSSDDGDTFDSMTYATTGFGLMRMTKLASGGILGIIRVYELTGAPAVVLYGGKDGQHWQKGRVFATSPNFAQVNMTYGQFAQGADGALYLVYASEQTGHSVADIMFVKADRW